jgi:hypothetical protein
LAGGGKIHRIELEKGLKSTFNPTKETRKSRNKINKTNLNKEKTS